MRYYMETTFPNHEFDPFSEEDFLVLQSEDLEAHDNMLAVKVSGRQFERITSTLQRLGIGYTVRHIGPTTVPKDPDNPLAGHREATNTERLALGAFVLAPVSSET